MSKLVFVYGSLLSGLGNHPVLGVDRGDAEFLGEATLAPEYQMYDLGAFPAVRRGGDTSIVGEVYRVNDEAFERLEYLEGYPDLYQRTVVFTPYGRAIMYHMERELHGSDRVPSGDWKAWLGGDRDQLELGV